jgi:uncharacterized membrane protein YfcA
MLMLLAIPIGLAIGVVVGTVGGGGAILALPALVYILDQGVGPATTASLIVIALAASFGVGSQARAGQLCPGVALAFAPPAALGAYLGTIAGAEVSARTLILAFVPILLAAGVLTLRRTAAREPAEEVGCPRPGIVRPAAGGLAVGVVTGFFGVGGGFLIVPTLTLLIGLGMRRAVATSLAIISITGVVALVSHLARGAEPDWPLTLVLCAGAAVGAVAGSAVGRRVSSARLARGFGVTAVAASGFLLMDVLLLGGPPTGAG